MFTIQQTKSEVMVWATSRQDGRKICVLVCQHRFEASLWIEAALRRNAKR